MLIADNIRVTDPAVSAAIEQNDPRPIQELVMRCEKAGAEAIDLNPGPLTKDPETKMTFIVETVRKITDLPLLIDTANPAAMEAGLLAGSGKMIINAFSPEPKKIQTILPLAKKYDVDIVGYLLYPDSQVPPDASERLSMALELSQATESAGIDKNRLIVDPVIVPITWQEGPFHAMEILSVIRELPNLLGYPVRTVAALSNLTSVKGPARTKRLMEKTYLPMLAASGLTMTMLNVLRKDVMQTAFMCKALSGEGIFCWESFYSTVDEPL